MKITIELDPESLRRLIVMAVNERRPIVLQAEVLVLQALGRWPVPDEESCTPEQIVTVKTRAVTEDGSPNNRLVVDKTRR